MLIMFKLMVLRPPPGGQFPVQNLFLPVRIAAYSLLNLHDESQKTEFMIKFQSFEEIKPWLK